MADLYGSNGRSSSHESEDISFHHNLLQNSSGGLASSPFASFYAKNTHSFTSPWPAGEDIECNAGLFRQSTTALSDSNCRFSDLSGLFPTEAKESISKSFCSAAAADSVAITSSLKTNFPPENHVGDFDFGREVHKASEGPENSVPPRSSKRTRAAEIHNLSEKRRRSRINEKLKALQTLIPNSNKTDKASMLDEAIEYLKHLQLQVQMLTLRNGSSLQPIYLQETQQSMQRGMDYDEGDRLVNPNGGGTFPQNQEISIQREFDISNHTPANPPIVIQSITNITNSDNLFGLQLSVENQYGHLNQLTSLKDICRVNTPSKLQTDLTFSGKIPSPGVSS